MTNKQTNNWKATEIPELQTNKQNVRHSDKLTDKRKTSYKRQKVRQTDRQERQIKRDRNEK